MTSCLLCLPSGLFMPAGVNTIAVHVSNTAGSSDAGFDLDLTYSSQQASTEAPGPVTGASATATNTTALSLKWTKPACDGSSFITRYDVTSTAAIGTKSVAVTDPFATAYTYAISGLTTRTTYAITIRAVNAAGMSTSVTVNGTTK